MAQAENSLGLFEEVELSITSKLHVRSASFHPIDPVLAFGLYSGEVLIVKGPNHSASLSTWKIERQFQCESTALSLKWNTNGTKLAAGCPDGSIIVWCYITGEKRIFRWKRRATFPMIVWNPFNFDGLASYNNAMDCKLVLIFDALTDHTCELISKANVFCVDWISCNRLAFSYDNGTIEVHQIELDDRSTSRQVRHFVISTEFTPRSPMCHVPGDRLLKSDVWNIAWNHQLKVFATSSQDGWIKVWTIYSQVPINMIKSSSDSFCCELAWSPTEFSSSKENVLEGKKNKPYLACGMFDGSISIWSPLGKSSMRPFTLFYGHSEQVHQVSFSPNGLYLASTDYDRKLVIWSTKKWEIIYCFPPSGLRYPFNISWDATSSKLGISERTGRKQLLMIENVVAESCCDTCKANSKNLKRCSRCCSVYYCSVECQRSHWAQHKTVCHKK